MRVLRSGASRGSCRRKRGRAAREHDPMVCQRHGDANVIGRPLVGPTPPHARLSDERPADARSKRPLRRCGSAAQSVPASWASDIEDAHPAPDRRPRVRPPRARSAPRTGDPGSRRAMASATGAFLNRVLRNSRDRLHSRHRADLGQLAGAADRPPVPNKYG
jgi:hypothetical protein